MHYNNPKLDQKMFGSLQPLSEFMEKMGKENIVPVQKLTIKKDDLADEMKVVVLEIAS